MRFNGTNVRINSTRSLNGFVVTLEEERKEKAVRGPEEGKQGYEWGKYESEAC